jgi:adenylate cyclase class IV
MFKVNCQVKISAEEAFRISKNLEFLRPERTEKIFYEDTYFVNPDNNSSKYNGEIRVREEYNNDDYKASFSIGEESFSEHEVEIDNAENIVKLLERLGYLEYRKFTREENIIFLNYKSYKIKIQFIKTNEENLVLFILETSVERIKEKDKIIHDLYNVIEYMNI